MHTKYLILISSFCINLIVSALESDESSLIKSKDCNDFPSCYLISSRMFANYCGKSTLKAMCPTFCLPECNLTTTITTTISTTTTLLSQDSTTTTTILPTTATTTEYELRTFKFNFAERLIDKEPSKMEINNFIKTLSTSTSSSTSLLTSLNKQKNKYSLFIPNNTTKEPELEDTTTFPSIIYVPLFQAGFISRIIVTSNKEECNFTRAIICKRSDSCDNEAAWCPESNNVPKEQIEFHFNYTIDIYMLETQGSMLRNETVYHFLLQYQNESGGLVSKIFKTDSDSSSSKINKFLFEHPLRTQYIRITPIEFTKAIVMRFEFYSKGILYTQN